MSPIDAVWQAARYVVQRAMHEAGHPAARGQILGAQLMGLDDEVETAVNEQI